MDTNQLHYSAFISYRHCSPDMNIARRIQHQLETFSIPRGLQKALGRKKLGKVFRDKEELPISSDLGLNIQTALDHSDYLIVICSRRTRESRWVEREITYFLEHHPRDHVLTVLADGEPDEAVPAFLTEDAEPLSCDYRLSPMKARRQELPRLAAAILGCRYDDLRQRQKQRVYRRIIAGACCAAVCVTALSCYFYATSRRIQAAYDQSLRNQSQYLASASWDAFDAGDRITAMLLALEALPSEDDPRPWTAEAEKALGIAMDLYSDKDTTRALKNYPHNAKLRDFQCSGDGNYLVSVDASGVVYVWQKEAGKLLYTVKNETVPALYCRDDRFILVGDEQITGYRLSDGEQLWQLEDRVAHTVDLVFDGQGSTFAYCNYDDELVICGLDGSEVLRRFCLPDSADPTEASARQCLAFTPDGSHLLFTWTPEYRASGYLAIYDLEKKQFGYADLSFAAVAGTAFLQDGQFLIYGFDTREDMMHESQILPQGLQFNETKLRFVCLSMPSGEILWDNVQTTYFPGLDTKPVLFAYPMEDGTVRDSVCCFLGNVCLYLDSATGERLERRELPDSTAFVLSKKEEDIPLAFLKNGMLAQCTPRIPDLYVTPYSVEASKVVKNGRGVYILPEDGSQILYYNQAPLRFDQLLTDQAGEFDSWYFGSDAFAACKRLETSDLYRGCSYEDGRELWQTELPNQCKALGVGSGGEQLYLWNWEEKALVTLELSDGTVKKTPLDAGEHSVIFGEQLHGDRVYCYMKSSEIGGPEVLSACRINPMDGSVTSWPLPESFRLDTFNSSREIYSSPDGSMAVLESGTEPPFIPVILDWETGSCTFLSEPVKKGGSYDYRSGVIAWSGDASLLVTPGREGLTLWNRQGEQLLTLENGGHLPVSAVFTPEGNLAVLYNDSEIYVYKTDGALLHHTKITEFTGGIPVDYDCRWQFTSHGAMLIVRDYWCFLLDEALTGNYAHVMNFCHYDESRDRLYVRCSSPETEHKKSICAYDRLTTEELIREAEKLLNGAELTIEQRNRYGLETEP